MIPNHTDFKSSIQVTTYVIIDSMPEKDDKGYSVKQTAPEIVKAMTDALKEIAPDQQPPIFHYKVPDSTNLFYLLEDLADAAKNKGIKPWVHFEMHGEVAGLKLMNGELVEWKQLTKPIRIINVNCGNNLFISLATCFGAYLLNIYHRFDIPAPFYGYVGSETFLWPDDIIVNFTEFYRTMILTGSITKGLIALKNTVNGGSYNAINCEVHFDRLLKNLSQSVLTEEAKELRLNEMYVKAMTRYPDSDPDRMRSFISYMVYGGYEEREFQRCRKIFLHIAKHPDFYDSANWEE